MDNYVHLQNGEIIRIPAEFVDKIKADLQLGKDFWYRGKLIKYFEIKDAQLSDKEEKKLEASQSGGQWCGKCENGWLFRDDPDPMYRSKMLAYPCKCNPEGSEKVKKCVEYFKQQDWYKSAMEAEDQRMRAEYFRDDPVIRLKSEIS